VRAHPPTEERNAIDPDTGVELYQALRRFEADPALHVAVLTGAGGVFCAGFDLKFYARIRRGEAQFPENPPPGKNFTGHVPHPTREKSTVAP
jgi:enoyl-CoA hydratase